MDASAHKKNFLLTGIPAVGKTTVIIKLAEMLGEKAVGFYTRELRSSKRREGFEIVSLKGEKAVLAHVDFSSPYKVSKYKVKPLNLNPFVSQIKQALTAGESSCFLIDEIGKMELFSSDFKQVVIEALDSPIPVVATVMQKNHPFCDELKNRWDVELTEITLENRDEVPRWLFNQLAKLTR